MIRPDIIRSHDISLGLHPRDIMTLVIFRRITIVLIYDNYLGLGLCYPYSTSLVLDNSRYHAQSHLVIASYWCVSLNVFDIELSAGQPLMYRQSYCKKGANNS